MGRPDEAATGAERELPFGAAGPPLDRRSPFAVGLTAALGVALAYVLVEAVVSARQVLLLVLVAAFLAIGLDPLVGWLVRRGLSRPVAVGVVAVGLLGVVAGVAAVVVPPVSEQISALIRNSPRYLQLLQDRSSLLTRFDARYHVLSTLQARLTAAGPTLALDALGGLVGAGKVVFGLALSTVTVVVLTLYFLAGLPVIKRTGYRLVPRSRRARVGLLTDEMLLRVGGFVTGNLLTSLVAGVGTFVFLEVVGVPYAVALGVVVAVADLVPIVGSTIGGTLVTLVALTVSLPVAIASLVFYVAYRLFEDYLLVPRVMRRTVDVSPLLTLVALIVGGALLGIIGALIAIPVAAAVQLVVFEVAYPRLDAL